MSKLTEKQKRHLRSLGHRLKPEVIIGAHGYTEAVRAELDTSLQRHELMKVRVSVGERETRDLIISQLCADTGAALVQRIGHIALIYRANRDKPRITLPCAATQFASVRDPAGRSPPRTRRARSPTKRARTKCRATDQTTAREGHRPPRPRPSMPPSAAAARIK